MSEEQHKIYLQEMTKAIEITIEKVVNGKIKIIDEKLNLFTSETRGWRNREFNDYVKNDEEWKELALPVIKVGNSLYAVAKIAVYFFGGLATIAGGITVIKIALINLISK